MTQHGSSLMPDNALPYSVLCSNAWAVDSTGGQAKAPALYRPHAKHLYHPANMLGMKTIITVVLGIISSTWDY